MRTITQYIIGLASITAAFAVTFDNQMITDGKKLSYRWLNARPTVEMKLRSNHTGIRDGKLVFFENSYDANVREVTRFVDLVTR